MLSDDLISPQPVSATPAESEKKAAVVTLRRGDARSAGATFPSSRRALLFRRNWDPPEERKVTTTAYDLSVDTLVSQWEDEILVIPKMQREYVWDNGRASRLVESLLLNIPVPPVFFSETADSKYEVIDGHQRIRSVVRYINNEFALSGLRLMTEHLRLRFHQLPSREQRYLRTRVLRAIVIGPDSHPSMKHEIFQRLNTGAIALNAQEIRHALNQGSLNDLLHDLVTLKDFRKCVGSKSPRRRMVDQELSRNSAGVNGVIPS